MSEYITIEDVRTAVEINPTKAMKELLNTMEELQQGRTTTVAFDNANAVEECQKCGNEFGSHRMRTEKVECYGQICTRCQKDIEWRMNVIKEEQKIFQNWKTLLTELQADNPKWKLQRYYGGYKAVLPSEKYPEEYVKIERDSYYSKHGYNRKYALRIYSSMYSKKASTLRKDFNGKKVGEGLIKKANAILEELENQITYQRELKKEQTDNRDTLKDMFGNLDGIKFYQSKYGRSTVFTLNGIPFQSATNDHTLFWTTIKTGSESTSVKLTPNDVIEFVNIIGKYKDKNHS